MEVRCFCRPYSAKMVPTLKHAGKVWAVSTESSESSNTSPRVLATAPLGIFMNTTCPLKTMGPCVFNIDPGYLATIWKQEGPHHRISKSFRKTPSQMNVMYFHTIGLKRKQLNSINTFKKAISVLADCVLSVGSSTTELLSTNSTYNCFTRFKFFKPVPPSRFSFENLYAASF